MWERVWVVVNGSRDRKMNIRIYFRFTDLSTLNELSKVFEPQSFIREISNIMCNLEFNSKSLSV